MFKDKKIFAWPLSAITVSLFFFYFLSNKEWNTTALIFTAIILVWYSIETKRLRIESCYANRLSVHPGLTLRYVKANPNGGGSWIFILSNEGKGAALNPEIVMVGGKLPLTFNMGGINAIYPGDTVPISWNFEGRINDQKLFEALSQKSLKVQITFFSALDLKTPLITEIEIKEPPESKVIKTCWT